MKTLYKIRPKRFKDIRFENNTIFHNHYFYETQWLNNIRLDVHYKDDANIIYLKISSCQDNEVNIQESFEYSSEEDALNWLFNYLESYGHTHNGKNNKELIFNIPYTLYYYLGWEVGDYENRGTVIEFMGYYKQFGSNSIILNEIASLGEMSIMIAPKMMFERIAKKAPHFARILVDFFVDQSINNNKILTYFSDNMED